MRRLIIANIMSLDGYVEGPGGNVTALPMDDFFDEHNLERLRAADTLLLGATTYIGLKGYWPAVAANPKVSPAVAANPEVADIHRETGERNNEIHKVVVSEWSEAQAPLLYGAPLTIGGSSSSDLIAGTAAGVGSPPRVSATPWCPSRMAAKTSCGSSSTTRQAPGSRPSSSRPAAYIADPACHIRAPRRERLWEPLDRSLGVMGDQDVLEVVARVPAPTDRMDQHVAGIEHDPSDTPVIHDQRLPTSPHRVDHDTSQHANGSGRSWVGSAAMGEQQR